jgi:hypothetical protein
MLSEGRPAIRSKASPQRTPSSCAAGCSIVSRGVGGVRRFFVREPAILVSVPARAGESVCGIQGI